MEFLGSAGSTALLASVETGTSATVTDLMPIIGLVGGIKMESQMKKLKDIS